MKNRTENIENDLLMEKEKKTNRVMANIISFVKIHKKMTIAIALFLCVAITGSIFLVNRLNSNTGKPQMVANFSQTIELTKRDISNSISVTGTLASANAKSISVDLSNVEVEEIYVEVGDVISEGDIICRFNSDDIQNSLKDAKTNLSITNTKTNMEIQSATDNLENAQIKRNIEAERASTEVANAYSEYEDKVSAESNAKSAMDSANSAANAKLSQYNSLKSELTSLEGSKTSIESEFGNIITELVSLGEANFSGISITNDISGISYDSNNQEVVEKVGKLNTLQTDYQSTITSITTKNTQLTSANEEYQNLKAQAATKTTVYEQAQTATKSASSSYQKAVQIGRAHV